MALWTKNELLESLSDQIIDCKIDDNLQIDEVVIDSRKKTKNALFIAISGENNDGHNFIDQAIENGSKLVLVEKNDQNLNSFILVKNSFKALLNLAKYSRNRSEAKIIGLTGSVGKTSTKEMLKLAFETQGKVFATFGNLNNHIGVPLSLSNFDKSCDYGIFEMGMNHLNEIEPLSKLVKPNLALITNVGPVHIEFFKDEEEIALAKSEIFRGIDKKGQILINFDSKHYDFLIKEAKKQNIQDENIFNFGIKEKSNYQILNYKIVNLNKSSVEALLNNGEKISYEISTSNPVIIFNSIIAISCLDLLGKDLKMGIKSLENFEESLGRGKIFDKKLNQKNITIIDDSYNASLPSMIAGINHALNLKKSLNKKRVILALGDMLELGEKSVEIHNKIVNHIKTHQIDFAILVGSNMAKSAEILPKNSYKSFLNSSLAANELENLLQDGDILYIKGSRGIKMEKIIENL